MKKSQMKIIRVITIIIVTILLALIALFFWGMDEKTIIAALVGGGLGAFLGLLLKELTEN